MSDEEAEKPFAVERAKTGRAKCKKCKCPIEKDAVRIAKLVSNPFSDGKMKSWHHLTCLFEVFAKQRATTKRIDDPEEDISGWQDLSSEDRKIVLRKIEEFEQSSPFKAAKAKLDQSGAPSKRKKAPVDESTPRKAVKKEKQEDAVAASASSNETSTRDDAFCEFRALCDKVASADAYTDKTAIVRRMFQSGSTGGGFKSDIKLWCKLLLPLAVKRIYNLQSKQLIKLFARVLVQDEESMLEDLEKGDVARTIQTFFESSPVLVPAGESTLTVQQVDQFLEKLSYLTREEDQIQHFRSIVGRCTAEDLKMIVRLIKHDLRINAGPKHILSAVDDEAYRAFQMSRDLNAVIERCLGASTPPSSPRKNSRTTTSTSPGGSKIALSVMTPVLPMLAEACKSVEMAMKKCPDGMLSEVKYDGERVQVHKRGTEFRYFSRSLKPVLPHKVNLFKEYIPKAFPDGDDLILDSEVLMIDTKTGQPLPFGTLGVHKKAEFKDANVCLFVFDCIYYNGEVLLHKTMQERRRILKTRMKEIPNRIMLSEVQEVNDPRDLAEMIAKVLRMGLEGLVLKDVNGEYEPGKRHWLKVKKDYLLGGAMADTADLLVLGAWYGTGNKGGMMSVFLMGCYDEDRDVWLTVTKVHTGHDDATLARLQDELDMVKIGKDPSKVPSWLRANKPMIPDFVARDPKRQPVWEITGAEFTNQGVHTADGISIRFPRVTRIRDDKDCRTATNLRELRVLFNRSSESIDVSALLSKNDTKPAVSTGGSGSLDTFVKREPIKTEPIKTEPIKTEPKDDEEVGTGLEIDTKNFKAVRKEGRKVKVKAEGAPPLLSKIKSENISGSEQRGKKIKIEPKDVDDQTDDSDRAKYYSFLENDFIEYSAAGSPLNWIEGRKPPKGLPAAAKPMSSLTDAELKSKAILKDVRASLARDFRNKKQKQICRTLKTLGATVLEDKDRHKSTHVIHDSTEVPSSSLQEYRGIPKTARHVSVSWVNASALASKIQDVEQHTVQLAADYCRCSCSH